jgi:hypothetical protein
MSISNILATGGETSTDKTIYCHKVVCDAESDFQDGLITTDLTVTGDALCSTVPAVNDQLTNKLYVDGAVAAAGYGDVFGPASATDNALVRFDSTTGKLVQNSTATLSDTGVLATETASINERLIMTKNPYDSGGTVPTGGVATIPVTKLQGKIKLNFGTANLAAGASALITLTNSNFSFSGSLGFVCSGPNESDAASNGAKELLISISYFSGSEMKIRIYNSGAATFTGVYIFTYLAFS